MAQKQRRSKRDPDEREQVNGESEDAEADEQPVDEAEEDFDGEDEYEDDEDDVEAEGDDDYEDEDEPDEDEPDEDEPEDEEGDGPVDFEAEMHELQEELGDEWILRFSVKGDDAWLTAEKTDGSQHVEAPTAEVLLDAVELLEDGGGQSG